MSLTGASGCLASPRTDSHIAGTATSDPSANSKPRMLLGLTMGLLAAVIGALYSVYATYGLARGLKSVDMTFLRTSVAGMVTLPVLGYYLRFEPEALTGQWRRWLAVALLAGPLFGELVFTAFQFTPRYFFGIRSRSASCSESAS